MPTESVQESNVEGAGLTLGAHAQRGLQYLVCVSVCVSAALFSHLAQLRGKQEIRKRHMGSKNKKAFCLKMFC